MGPRFSRAKSSVVACLLILGLVALAVIQTGQPSVLAKDRRANSTSKPQILAAYARLPLSFEANQGQTDSQVQFLSRGNGYSLFLTPTEAVLTLRQSEPRPNQSRDRKGAGITGPQNNPQITQISQNQSQSAPSAKSVDETAVLRMKLLGANPAPPATGLDELPGKSNYFLGNDPKQWRTNVPNYAKVRFAGVYPGVDLVYYGEPAPGPGQPGRQLEYDFVVAPGADPSAIRLGFAGAERLEIDPQGGLALQTPAGEVRWHKPVVYQEVGGVRQMVDGHYVRKGKTAVGFEIASYDPRRALIIDPVLVYSTYLGGSGTTEQGVGIAVDSSGNAYVTGYTNSASFPGTSTSLIQPVFGGGTIGPDAFVTKLNPAGNALVYSTYLGGSIGEIGYGIAVDSTGNAYVTGRTDSPTFPMANAFDSTLGGAIDAFVTKLNPAGSALVYSTYLGGSSFDWGLGIAVDSSGNAYVTGLTQSANFPTASPIQAASGGGDRDAFVTKLNAAGSVLVYSTYLGGSSFDQGKGIAVDSSGNAYVTGTTDSTNFPTFNALQPTSGGGFDVFVTKLNAAGSALVYSTYLGGSGTDGDAGIGGGIGIAVDSTGNAYVTGRTQSTTFPGTSSSPIQPALGGNFDAFVTKLNATGSALVYSTYLGGSSIDQGFGIAVDSSGNAYVTGLTLSANFPTFNALQPTSGGGFDVFVTKLNAAGSALVYSTYLGGSGTDGDAGVGGGIGIAVDSLALGNNAYVTGFTDSTNFPTANPFQPALGGGFSGDAFVSKIGAGAPGTPTISLVPTSLTFTATAGGANPASQTVSVSNIGGGTLNWTATASTTPPGGTWLSVLPASGTNSGTLTISANIAGLAAAVFNGAIQVAAVGASNTPQNVAVTLTVTAPPPPPPPSTISELVSLVESLPPLNCVEPKSLLAKLDAAQDSIKRDNKRAACGQLGAFVNEVEAKAKKCIDPGIADEMINLAEAIRASLGCR